MRCSNRSCLMGILLLAGLLILPGLAPAKTVTVGSASGALGQTVKLPITIDDPTGVGGVAFTLTYDASTFEFVGLEQVVKVISNGDEYKVPGTDPPEYSVEGQTEAVGNTLFYRYNDDAPGNQVMIAGASAQALTDSNLFRAKFLIKEGAALGDYPIGLAQTSIDNPAAGYDGLTPIPVLVGMPAETANEQGFYETPTFAATLVDGTISVVDSLPVIPGDVNGDNTITIEDVRFAFSIFLGLEVPNADQYEAANIYDDGLTITIDDVRGVFKIFLGLPI
jgi:hypothetical protein